MGLGKTVMTIALILARMGKGCPDNQKSTVNKNVITEKKSQKSRTKARGGTLIVCPMALLGQWKVHMLCKFMRSFCFKSKSLINFTFSDAEMNWVDLASSIVMTTKLNNKTQLHFLNL